MSCLKVVLELQNNIPAPNDDAVEKFLIQKLKPFPDLNLGLHEVSVKGINQFEDDTLVYFESFNVQVNLLSAIKKNVVVKGIVLNKPFINA